MFVFTQLAAAAAQNQVISLVTHSKHGSTQSSLNCPPPSLWSGLCKIFSLSSLQRFICCDGEAEMQHFTFLEHYLAHYQVEYLAQNTEEREKNRRSKSF